MLGRDLGWGCWGLGREGGGAGCYWGGSYGAAGGCLGIAVI